MANDRQFRIRTQLVATRGVSEYRQSIAHVVRPGDRVLELGCEWGTTTVLIAPACREVIGTDVSRDCIERARRSHPDIRFEVLDAFDLRSALEIAPAPDVVYIDLSGFSGYRSLLDVIALADAYAAAMRPRAIVLKSGALKSFAARCTPFRGGPERRLSERDSPRATDKPDNAGV